MRRLLALLTLLGLLAVAACGSDTAPSSGPGLSPVPTPSAPSTPTTADSAPTSDDSPEPGSVPPSWLGTRALPTTAAGFGVRRPTPKSLRERRFTLPDTVDPLPGKGFASRVSTPAPAEVLARSTWTADCPVAAGDLSWIRLTFWGFDDRRHTGELLVNRRAAADLVAVFRDLYDARFPIEELRITTPAELTAKPTGDGNNTGAFSCRPTVGSNSFSQHAYGLAVDLNPFQNPYLKGDLLLPELAGSYLDRSWRRPGMIHADGSVVRAFTRIGWTWGGTWRTLKDLHHFSANGR